MGSSCYSPLLHPAFLGTAVPVGWGGTVASPATPQIACPHHQAGEERGTLLSAGTSQPLPQAAGGQSSLAVAAGATGAAGAAAAGVEAIWMGVDPGALGTGAMAVVESGIAAATVAGEVSVQPPSFYQVSATGTCPPHGWNASFSHGYAAGGTGHGSGTDTGTTCRQPALRAWGAGAQCVGEAQCGLGRRPHRKNISFLPTTKSQKKYINDM